MDYIGTIGTVVFGFLSIYYFQRSRSVKRPQFIYQTILLQTKKHPNISILFNGEQIINLSRTYILFCNKGNKEIRKEDIPLNQFPSIKFNNDIKVLSVNKTAVSSDHNNFTVQLNNDHVDVNFDYINQNDGIVFEILFDSDAKELPAKLVAPFIGTSSSKLDRYITGNKKIDIIGNILGFSLLCLVPMIAIFDNILTNLPVSPSIIQIVSICLLLVIYVIVLWISIRDYYKYKLPDFAKEYFK